jgi:hypothetical protein
VNGPAPSHGQIWSPTTYLPSSPRESLQASSGTGSRDLTSLRFPSLDVVGEVGTSDVRLVIQRRRRDASATRRRTVGKKWRRTSDSAVRRVVTPIPGEWGCDDDAEDSSDVRVNLRNLFDHAAHDDDTDQLA